MTLKTFRPKPLPNYGTNNRWIKLALDIKTPLLPYVIWLRLLAFMLLLFWSFLKFIILEIKMRDVFLCTVGSMWKLACIIKTILMCFVCSKCQEVKSCLLHRLDLLDMTDGPVAMCKLTSESTPWCTDLKGVWQKYICHLPKNKPTYSAPLNIAQKLIWCPKLYIFLTFVFVLGMERPPFSLWLSSF